MNPTPGRIVLYTLNKADANAINLARTAESGRVGNQAYPGDVCPATVVRVFGETPGSAANLQVHLDGNDTYWATSRCVGDGEGRWVWPARA